MKSLRTRNLVKVLIGVGAFALMTPLAFAAGTNTQPANRPAFTRPAVMGTVASISGDTLTVTEKNWQRPTTQNSSANAPTQTNTTYTVDATNAKVTKDGKTATLSEIAVGDMVVVTGTTSGTTVTATTIMDGMGMMGRGNMPNGGWKNNASSTMPIAHPMFTGNGEPIVGGSVTAISGDTLSITAKGGTSYTVDASGATVLKGNATSTIASVATGDNVIVQGTVNGSAVTATTVIDQGAPNAAPANGKPVRKILGAIGGFFTRIFGFF